MLATCRVSVRNVSEATEWARYVIGLFDGETVRASASRVGQAASTVSRWRTGAALPEPRQAVAVARAYGRSPLEALEVAGYLTRDELDIPVERPRALQLRDFTDLELSREIVRRADKDGILNQPIDHNHPAMQREP